MEQSMDRETRRKTEYLMSQVFVGLEGLAKLHGDSLHIGAGMRRDGRDRTFIIYNTNPQDNVERPGEIWLPQQVPFKAVLLSHKIPMQATATEDEAAPRFSRAPMLCEQANKAAQALIAVGE
jgi:hypothetical protein